MDKLETIKTWKQDGFDMRLETFYEYDPDLSWIGEFSEKATKDGRDGIPVDPVTTRSGYLLRGHHYFYPQPGLEEYADRDEERLRDYYLEHWSMVVVGVTASRAGVDLGTAYLGGVESDAGSYFHELATELAPEAIDDALDTLDSLGIPA